MIRIDGKEETISLEPTTISEQGFDEDDLREWILDSPRSVLGEDVLLIGREVKVREIGDGIDLLAIDRDGNVLIIELKQGRITGNVDFQALKYAAYASHWDYSQLRDQFNKFKSTSWGRAIYDEDSKFTEVLDEFCNDDYTLNQDQRLLLVGEVLSERLELVTRWLSDRDIDVTAVEIQLLEDDDRLYLDVEQKVPVPADAGTEVSPDTSEEPWKDNGREWHLNEVSNDETAELLSEVAGALEEVDFLDGPHWGQKQYLSFKQDRKIRVTLRTKRTLFHVNVYDIPVQNIDVDSLASKIRMNKEDVRAEAEDLRSGRPGIGITFRGGEDYDLDALPDIVRSLVDGDQL